MSESTSTLFSPSFQDAILEFCMYALKEDSCTSLCCIHSGKNWRESKLPKDIGLTRKLLNLSLDNWVMWPSSAATRESRKVNPWQTFKVLWKQNKKKLNLAHKTTYKCCSSFTTCIVHEPAEDPAQMHRFQNFCVKRNWLCNSIFYEFLQVLSYLVELSWSKFCLRKKMKMDINKWWVVFDT